MRHHRRAADFGAGAGRGWHRDDRCDAFWVGARPVIADILEIPHRPRLAGHEGNELADIERRAAAKGDYAVMVSAPVRGDTLRDIRFHRVRLDLAEQSRAWQLLERGLGHRHFGEHGIRHKQRIVHPRRFHRIGEFADAPGAEAHAGRITPVAAQFHHTVLR